MHFLLKQIIRVTKYFKRYFWSSRRKIFYLNNNDLSIDKFSPLVPKSPTYFFYQRDTFNINYYLNWPSLERIFKISGSGIVTARDSFSINISKVELLRKIQLFKDLTISDEIVKEALHLKENYAWKVHQQRLEFNSVENLESYVDQVLYRPFDIRYIFYHHNIVFRPRKDIMSHMTDRDNLAIILLSVEYLTVGGMYLLLTKYQSMFQFH